MALPKVFEGRLSLPLIGSPMFIVSQPDLVIAQCKAGVIGSMPGLNARSSEILDEWLGRITKELDEERKRYPDKPVAPFAVNQIMHDNVRIEQDMELCIKHKVPLIITTWRPPTEIVKAAHSYGGLVFHDATNVRHAKKALDAGVDGLILVAGGAGGHAGRLNPFALVEAVRQFYDGPVVLSGAMSRGDHILAAQAMGADMAYMGTRFIATREAVAVDAYKQMLIDSTPDEVVYTPLFSGTPANYLTRSVEGAGFDPANLPAPVPGVRFGSGSDSKVKVWRDIWGGGQSTGGVTDVLPAAELIARMKAEYEAARTRLSQISEAVVGPEQIAV